ncbi:MAG: hypothetical protein M0R75_06910, partial [Dehalococcoidia bacterium]|nr:hypothetical protein [Dehalococcoidia bacterium]
MAATTEEIARALANGAPVRWRLLSCDRRGNPRALGDSTTADLSDALLWESGDNPGLDGGRIDLDNDSREIALQATVRLDLARVPGGAGLGDISHVRLLEDRLVQPGGAGIRYETALTYWQRQAEQETGGGLWSLAETVGDALDLSGHGNDGTVVYAEGQRAVEPSLYDRGLPGMRFEEGTTNRALNPSFEVDLSNTSAITGGTQTRDTDKASVGDASMRCDVAMGGGTNQGRDLRLEGSYTVGQAIAVSLDLEGSAARSVVVQLYDSSNGVFYSAGQGLRIEPTLGTGAFTRYSMNGVITHNTSALWVRIRPSNDTGAWSFWVDAWQGEIKSAPTSYCDGSLGTGYSWASTEHASASTRVASSVNLGSGDELDDIFDGGGAVGVLFNMAGRPAESAFSRLFDKNQWVLYVDGDNRAIYFNRTFSGGLAQWRSQLGAVAFGVNYALVVGYDDTDAGNDPAMYLANLDTGVVTQLTITEAAAPSGTASTDASSTLYVGNNANGNRTWYGVQALPRLWQGTQPTEDEIAEFFTLAQTARPTYTPAPEPEWVEFSRGIFVASFADTTHNWDGRPIATLQLNDLTA